MKIKMAVLSIAAMMLLSGCSTSLVATKNFSNTTTKATSSDKLDPKVYMVCRKIYNDVNEAVKENRESTFDSELQPITQIGQNSPKNSPNGILYTDAVTLVAFDDGMNGDGVPQTAYDDLKKSLAKMKHDLDKYQPATK